MSQTLLFPDAVPALFSDMLYLRELMEDDVPAWFERASDPESAVLAGDPIPESIERAFNGFGAIDSGFASKRVSDGRSYRRARPIVWERSDWISHPERSALRSLE